jgi:hypothetical protein
VASVKIKASWCEFWFSTTCILHWSVDECDLASAVTHCSTRVFWGVITTCWAKSRCVNLRGKRLRERWRLWFPLSLKVQKFVDTEHLHSVWVCDAVSCRDGWVSLFACV